MHTDSILQQFETNDKNNEAISNQLWEYLQIVESKVRLEFPYSVSVPWLDTREEDVDLLVFILVQCCTKRDAEKVQQAIKLHQLDQLDYPVLLLSDSLCGLKIEHQTNIHQLGTVMHQIEQEWQDVLRQRFGWSDLAIVNHPMIVVNHVCKADEDHE